MHTSNYFHTPKWYGISCVDLCKKLHNLAAALFRLENSRTQQDFRIVLKELIEWLKAPEQTSLRRAFTVWMRRVLLPKRLSVKEIPNLSELHEVNAMLETEEINWAREWHKEARQEAPAGRTTGRHTGRHTERPTERSTGRPTERSTGRHTRGERIHAVTPVAKTVSGCTRLGS